MIRSLTVLFFCSLLLLASPAWAGSKEKVGKVLNKTIYLADIENKQINDLRQKVYQAKLQIFKVTSLELLAKTHKAYRINLDVKIPDSDLRSFYKKQGLSAKGSYPQFRSKIHDYLASQIIRQQIEDHYAKAVRKKLIQPYLKEPQAILVSVPLGTAYLWGKANKKQAMILEFSDYHCPYCNIFKATMDKVKAKYKGKALFGYRHFPLPLHKRADEAAIAAECAREQGKFNQIHNLLYKNQSLQTDQDYIDMAREAGVDKMVQFGACLQQGKYRSLVNADKRAAGQIGIVGTPSMVIGTYDPKTKSIKGEVFSGALSVTDVEGILKKYMK